MYKLEFGEELFYYYYYYYLQKIFRDPDLTCIKEFCDPAMILEKEKSRASALSHTQYNERKAAAFSLLLIPH